MSRRVVAPALLLVAAALSLAAVFAVHRIESRGGPVAEPWATPFFSPNGDGEQDEATIRFTTQRPERVTVVVVDSGGTVVRMLARDEHVDGRHSITWNGSGDDGSILPEGEYRVHITRAGDSRVYSPTRPVTIDVTEPIGRLDRSTWVDGELRGLAQIEPDSTLEAVASNDTVLEDLRSYEPHDSLAASQPVGPRIPDTVVVRFAVPLDRDDVPLDTLRLYVVDRAGNRVDLLAGPNAPKIKVVDES